MTGRAGAGRASAVGPRLGRRSLVAGSVGGLLAADRFRLTAAQCESVELFPGYPDYRGFVTGLDDVGDHACAEDLAAAGFDRGGEDRANRAAARRLGLVGGIKTWTWENWLAVEAQRGLLPTCYACAIAGAGSRPSPPRSLVAPDDPRLLIGSFGTTHWRTGLAVRHNLPSYALSTPFPTDQHLRAYLYLMHPRQHLNARDIIRDADPLIAEMNRPGGALPSPLWLFQNALNQGGYSPTPPTAAPEDQIFMMWFGFLTGRVSLPAPVHAPIMAQLEFAITDWLGALAQGETASLAEWIRATGAMGLVTG